MLPSLKSLILGLPVVDVRYYLFSCGEHNPAGSPFADTKLSFTFVNVNVLDTSHFKKLVNRKGITI